MAAGAEHLKERVSEYVLSKRSKPASETYTGTLAGNWNEERFDSRLSATGGKRAALPTELDHTWQSSYGNMTAADAPAQAAEGGPRQLSQTTVELLDTLSGSRQTTRLSQRSLLDVVDGRHRAFPGHQPEQDLPGSDGRLPSEVPPSTVCRDSFIAPEEHRRREQVNAADVYYGPAHDKARFVVFKLVQSLQNRGISARESVAKANGKAGNTNHVRTNFSFTGLRQALLHAERKPPVPGISKSDGKVTMQELGDGLRNYGVPLEQAELLCLFKHLARDGAREVAVIDAVRAIRGAMNDRRRGVVARAFALLETTVGAKKGVPHGQPVAITFHDVLTYFDATAHPDVRAGIHTADFVMKQLFEEHFSIETERMREAAGKAVVTLSSFSEVYEDWSALVDADHYFERSVRDTWHLSGGTGLAQNTSCRRVQVVHTNGRITQQIIIDDLGVAADDEEAMRANLRSQGIKDVKKITPANE